MTHHRSALDRAVEELAQNDKRWVHNRETLWTWNDVVQVETSQSIRCVVSHMVGNIYLPHYTPKKDCKRTILRVVRMHQQQNDSIVSKVLNKTLF